MTPDEIATEFLLSIRYARLEGDDYIENWKVLGRTVLRRGTGRVNKMQGRPADFGSPVEVVNWPSASREKFVEALTPLVTEDRERRVFLVPTLEEATDALSTTDSNDLSVICDAMGLDDRDLRIARIVWTTTARFPLHATRNRRHYPLISEAEYGTLRAVARQTDIEYVLTLLEAGVPAASVIELSAVPPMPIEYAVAMFGVAA